MPLVGPMGPAGFRRRGRRRGLVVGMAAGAAMGRASANNNAAAQEPAAPAPVDNSADQMAEIERLGKLKEEGLITQEEFDAKKKQILGL